jgi:hypothetical protein
MSLDRPKRDQLVWSRFGRNKEFQMRIVVKAGNIYNEATENGFPYQ